MCTEKETGTWLPLVKKTVDTVYDYLIQHPDGITMSTAEYGKRGQRVCTKLVSRGIIEKQILGRAKGCRYKWVASMAPTKVLYGSIAQELYHEDRKYLETHMKKMKGMKVSPIEKPQEIQVVTELFEKPVSPLAPFSIQELWDEIKRKGGFIEDNKLAVTTYFN